MGRGKLEANPGPDIAVACQAIENAGSQRARLMGASALAGGALRGLAVAAGMVAAFGGAPARAQCFVNAVGTLSGPCFSTATGSSSTAVGGGANATGDSATAYGFGAVANGN